MRLSTIWESFCDFEIKPWVMSLSFCQFGEAVSSCVISSGCGKKECFDVFLSKTVSRIPNSISRLFFISLSVFRSSWLASSFRNDSRWSIGLVDLWKESVCPFADWSV